MAYNHPTRRARRGARRDASSRRRPTTGRSSTCGPRAAVALPRRAGAGARALSAARRSLACCGATGSRDRLVVALLLSRRRLHAPRDQVDHPVRAVVGIDLGRRLAGDRLGADDGDGAPASSAGSRSRGRGSSAPCCWRCWRSLRVAGRRVPSPAARPSRCSTAADVQPGPLRGPALQSSLKRGRVRGPAYGANLLGAMVGGVAEYLSLVTGFQFLLVVVAACYLVAIASRGRGIGRRKPDNVRS